MKNVFRLLLLFISFAGFTQTKSARNSPALTEGSPESAGMSVERITRMDHTFQNAINIRHPLTDTSGLGYGVIDGDERFKAIYKKAGITDLFTTDPVKIGESVRKLAKLPLHHNPGEKFTYSEGLDVLGYFIEVVS